MELDSWILTKKFFDPQRPERVESDRTATGFWKPGDIPENVIKDNEKWAKIERNYHSTENRFTVSPYGWKSWYLPKQRFNPAIAVNYLIHAKIIPDPKSGVIPRLTKETREKLVSLWLSIVPSQKCIKKQIDYIYKRPERFLVLVNYGHDEAEMLASGRNIKSEHSLPLSQRMQEEMNERYLLNYRIPKDILEKYAAMSSLERYGMLNSVILNAPYCHRPIILFRGSRNEIYDLSDKRSGYRFVNNSILSTSINMATVDLFAGQPCCIYVFYVAQNVPRLFMNRREHEFLLPAGLLMEYVSSDRIQGQIYHRIRILKMAEDADTERIALRTP